MTHSHHNLKYHLVWSTKNREHLITPDIKHRLYGYIRTIINDKKQRLQVINGMPDHIHMLVSLSPTMCLADFIKFVKTNSTKWLRSIQLNKQFAWQEGYGAFTVGYSTNRAVINYINKQEEHHKICSFEEEFIQLLKMQDIEYDERFIFG